MTEAFGAHYTSVSNKPGVALLIDGENISHEHADAILRRSLRQGQIAVKRVYGNVSKIPGWDSTPGFRVIHSGSGKNSADMMLVIDALDLAHTALIGTFIIVSSDRDFSHLSFYLRERHLTVIGVGEAKSAPALRQSYTIFAELESLEKDKFKATPDASCIQEFGKHDQTIHKLIVNSGTSDGLPIAVLGVKMHSQHNVKISTLPEKTWRAYLLARSNFYTCDPRGPHARVRLVAKA